MKDMTVSGAPPTAILGLLTTLSARCFERRCSSAAGGGLGRRHPREDNRNIISGASGAGGPAVCGRVWPSRSPRRWPRAGITTIDSTTVRAQRFAPMSRQRAETYGPPRRQVVFAGGTNSLHKRIRPFSYAVGQDGDPRVPIL